MGTDIREDIEKAFATHEAAGEQELPEITTPAEGESQEPSEQVLPEGQVPEVGETKEVKEEKLPPTKAGPSGKSDTRGAKPAAAPTKGTGAPAAKAPASWKPEERELWAKLNPAAQGAVLRREKEIEEGLRQAADARRFKGEFDQTVQPYMTFIAAEGGTPLSAFQTMMQSGAILRVGSPQQKAALLVDAIQRYGVDIRMLDAMLSGKVQQMPQNNPELQYVEQQLAPVRQFMNEMRQAHVQGEQILNQNTEQTIEQFANDPKNEFFDDVRDYMADILDIAANRNQTVSLQEAYNRAILMHPQVSAVVSQRKVNEKAAQLSAAATKATNASASLPSGGAAPSQSDGSQYPMSRKAEIEAAWDKHMGNA